MLSKFSNGLNNKPFQKSAVKTKGIQIMRKLQNTLYITTQGSYLHKERETLVVEQERKKVAQLPVHAIGHIFCFGNVSGRADHS
ncbi:CRISPR-associated protein cas1 [Neisseria shayeganii 871]|uniref:CRISPR-associated protein cas1 n=1 Tax=Neisseria shayeganii 871 TaxID=1032488 RepID=G4CEH2_9NEIS|nr:CRISPR-associated protein cas1 [Neisseria shayeganii 871]